MTMIFSGLISFYFALLGHLRNYMELHIDGFDIL